MGHLSFRLPANSGKTKIYSLKIVDSCQLHTSKSNPKHQPKHVSIQGGVGGGVENIKWLGGISDRFPVLDRNILFPRTASPIDILYLSLTISGRRYILYIQELTE